MKAIVVRVKEGVMEERDERGVLIEVGIETAEAIKFFLENKKEKKSCLLRN